MERFRLRKIVLCLLVCCFGFVHNLRISVLTDHKWTLKNSSNHIIKNDLSQPSGIITDLTKAGVLNEGIYYRFNDVNYRWVARRTWIYSLHFTVKDHSSNIPTEIIFHGLDGLASITLNGNHIGNTTNTFVRYRFDVTKLLTPENDLEIKFEAPIESANRLANSTSHPVPPSCVPPNYSGECHVNFLRRVQASFGWDWGLAVPSVGIWKPIELVTYDRNDLLVRDITVATVREPSQWRVNVTVFCESSLKQANDIVGKLRVTLFVKNRKSAESTVDIRFSSKSPSSERSFERTILVPNNEVDLWWPNGYGEQPLYPLTASFEIDGYKTSHKTIKIGFRTINLVQQPVNNSDPNQGLSFYFNVNGVKVFAKGTNYIPSSILPEETDSDSIKHLLLSSKSVHMNMIRIWGGGRYESDEFYELCDQYGIMVWQDMMFACSMYPVDEPFLNSVSQEVSQQVKRLQHHASIALWAGNNENEAALRDNWYSTRYNFSLFESEYVKLYVTTIRKIVLSLDSTRYYAVSSPSNGLKSEQDGYVSKNPYDSRYGDVHYYDYFHNSWRVDHFPMTRFASEYGYQSMASLSTWRQVATDEDLSSLNSAFLEHRQHLPVGNVYLVYLMAFHFGAPDLSNVSNLIYLSQINQAMSVKTQTEWYRSWRGRLQQDGKGDTMGAMYWQLNDVWQTTSWSSIEFGGKWKMMHYYAKHFFAPVIVTARINTTGVDIYVISDLLHDIPSVILQVELYRWNSTVPAFRGNKTIVVKAETSQLFHDSGIGESTNLFASNRLRGICPMEMCFAKFTLKKQTGTLIHQNFLYPVSFKMIRGLTNCDVQATDVNCLNEIECDIRLTTTTICAFLWLDVGNIRGHFSDNGFTMTENERLIRFTARDPITSADLQKALTVAALDKQRIHEWSSEADPVSSVVNKMNRLYSSS